MRAVSTPGIKSVEMPSASSRAHSVSALPSAAVRPRYGAVTMPTGAEPGAPSSSAWVVSGPALGGLETRHHAGQVVGRHADVAVVNKDVGVARLAQHLDQVAHLAGGAQPLRALDQPDRAFGELRAQPLDLGDGGVVQAAHAEQDLELARVLLAAVAHQAGVQARVHALHRLQDADVRRKRRAVCSCAQAPPPGVLEVARAPQRQQHVDQPAHGQ